MSVAHLKSNPLLQGLELISRRLQQHLVFQRSRLSHPTLYTLPQTLTKRAFFD